MATDRDDFAIAFRSAFLKKGAQQKFSLFILVLVSLLILYIDTLDSKPLNLVRSIFKDGIYKASSIIALPEKGFVNLSRGISGHLAVHSKNKDLTESINLLEERSYENTYLKIFVVNKTDLLIINLCVVCYRLAYPVVFDYVCD